MPAQTREEAAAERSRAIVQRSHRPSARRDRADERTAPRSPYRAASAATAPLAASLSVERAAKGGEVDPDGPVILRGYATAYEQPYPMWDAFGPYTEVVSAGAGEATLKRSPDVKFLFNHRDMPMARTLGPGTLELTEDDHGLLSVAQPLMSLAISRDVVAATDAGLIHEMSYAFMITRGVWSPDFTEYRIHEYDIDRGDTSAVTYGANPFTDITVERAAQAARAELSEAQRQAARRILAAPLLRT